MSHCNYIVRAILVVYFYGDQKITNTKRQLGDASILEPLGYASLNFLTDFQYFVLAPGSNLTKRYNNSGFEEFLNSYRKIFWVTTCIVKHVLSYNLRPWCWFLANCLLLYTWHSTLVKVGLLFGSPGETHVEQSPLKKLYCH